MVCVIDFDGTLLKNDFFKESFFIQLIENPFYFIQHFLIKKASFLALKHQLLKNRLINYSIDHLINPLVLAWIQENRSLYKEIVIVSASPDFFVKALLSELQIFDGIYGSEAINLKGPNKLAFIKEKWGNAFHYMGDAQADQPIFLAAQQAYKVSAKGISKL
jgi:phosphoserine phosphatase